MTPGLDVASGAAQAAVRDNVANTKTKRLLATSADNSSPLHCSNLLNIFRTVLRVQVFYSVVQLSRRHHLPLC